MEGVIERRLSRTIICPRCGGYAVTVGRTGDGLYMVRCERCGEFKITALTQRTARVRYSKKMKDVGEAMLSGSF